MNETKTNPAPAETAPVRTLPVDRVVRAIRTDCQERSGEYLEESQAPGGGE